MSEVVFLAAILFVLAVVIVLVVRNYELRERNERLEIALGEAIRRQGRGE